MSDLWDDICSYKFIQPRPYKYDVFLICPVRYADDEQKTKLQNYINFLENKNLVVYYPARDTKQDDPIGYQICLANRAAIYNSQEIHLFWDKNSKGSLFDLGMAFMACKKLFIVNPDTIEKTECKSFENMILEWDRKSKS